MRSLAEPVNIHLRVARVAEEFDVAYADGVGNRDRIVHSAMRTRCCAAPAKTCA